MRRLLQTAITAFEVLQTAMLASEEAQETVVMRSLQRWRL